MTFLFYCGCLFCCRLPCEGEKVVHIIPVNFVGKQKERTFIASQMCLNKEYKCSLEDGDDNWGIAQNICEKKKLSEWLQQRWILMMAKRWARTIYFSFLLKRKSAQKRTAPLWEMMLDDLRWLNGIEMIHMRIYNQIIDHHFITATHLNRKSKKKPTTTYDCFLLLTNEPSLLRPCECEIDKDSE